MPLSAARRCAHSIPALLALAVAAPALAMPIGYVSQTRTVDASAQAGGGPAAANSAAAPDFGPFSDSANASSMGMVIVFPTGAAAFASQTSSLGAASITLSGSANAEVGQEGDASGTSTFSVQFAVAVPVTFTASGSLSASGFAMSQVRLTGPGGTVFSQTLIPFIFPDTLPIAEVGMLQPGTYDLFAEAETNANPGMTPLDASFAFSFDVVAVPEPGTAALLALGLLWLLVERVRLRS